jgi:hypothetical protein
MVSEARVVSFSSRLIGVSMLIGALLAAAVAPSRAGATARVYFEGAGFALTNIVSVIVAASCFGEGIKELKLHRPISELIGDRPDLVWLFAGGLTLAFATLCGSGMAATRSLYGIYAHQALGIESLLRVGAVTSRAHLRAVDRCGAARARAASRSSPGDRDGGDGRGGLVSRVAQRPHSQALVVSRPARSNS